jgi:AcrR family transcriptional regulator
LAEAWALAHRDGLAAISLRDLADRVDLRQPSLYAYFDSKLGLYDLMFADGNRQLLELVGSLALSDDPRDALVAFVEALVRFSTEDVVRHQILFQRTIPGFEPSPTSYALALEFYEVARQRLAATAVSDPGDVDVFSALVSQWTCFSPTSTDAGSVALGKGHSNEPDNCRGRDHDPEDHARRGHAHRRSGERQVCGTAANL